MQWTKVVTGMFFSTEITICLQWVYFSKTMNSEANRYV